MNDKTLGEYKRTTPDPDETTGEALARLQAVMTHLLDEADAELRDDMDGGVAAALIEKEAAKLAGSGLAAHFRDKRDMERARAEQAEKERDEARAEAESLSRQLHDAQQDADMSRAEMEAESRPLTARENLAALWESAHRPVGGRIPAGTAIITRSDHGNGDVRYQTLEATGRDLPDEGRTLERNYPYGPEDGEEYRLLDPPARPEGAEELAEVIDGLFTGDEGIYADDLADSLARCGVRVVGEEQP